MATSRTKPHSDRPSAGPSRGSGRRPPGLVPSNAPRNTRLRGCTPARSAHRRRATRFAPEARPASMRSTRSASMPHPRPSSHAIQGMRLRAATSSRLANASGRDTASVHAVLPFGIHASPSLVVACDDELRPCARTCAPEHRDPVASTATGCCGAVPPPAPCRSSAAVSVAGPFNPPSMAGCLGDLARPACGRLDGAIASPCASDRAEPAPAPAENEG